MHLKIDHLETVVKKAIKEERTTRSFREEVTRVLGPVMDTEVKLVQLAESVNERLDVLQRTGREHGEFKTSTLMQFTKHKNPEVRKMAVRLLPESKVLAFAKDRSRTVRIAVANRAPLKIVKEMMKRFPSDEQLRLIYSRRRTEVARPLTEASEEEFDMYGEEALGDSARTHDDGLELSDVWYDNKAMEIFKDYNHQGPIDFAWEERAVANYVQHTKATSGVEIDQTKLYDALVDLIEKNEEDELQRQIGVGTLDESIDFDTSALLRECAESLDESAEMLPEYVEPVDSVKDLVESGVSGTSLMSRTAELFQIKESTLPGSVKKYVLGEGHHTVLVPSKGRLPHNEGVREIDEKLLDMFCEAWNQDKQMDGEPFRLEWTNDPCDMNNVGFTVMLK